jgi:hypothetical protein
MVHLLSQHQVEQHDVGFKGGLTFEGLLAVFGKADKFKIGFLGQHRRQALAQDGVIVSDHDAYTPFFVFTLLHVTLAAGLLQNTHTHYNSNASHTRLTSAFFGY